MLVLSGVDALEVGNVHDDGVLDVLELFGADVHDRSVFSALHVDFQTDEVLVELQVVVLEVDFVAALSKGSYRN